MQTLVDLFELSSRAPVPTPRTPTERATADEGHDWGSSTTESSPGVSIESWNRARGWSSEEDGG